MPYLQKPNFSVEDIFDDIKNGKTHKITKELFENHKAKMISDSNNYDILMVNGHGLDYLKNSEVIKSSLFDKAVIEKYKTKLKSNATFCYLCGASFVYSVALDHFLPRSHFATLSITPQNLIPICNSCNSHKYNKYCKDDEPKYFHPYYEEMWNDWLEVEVFLMPTVSFTFHSKNSLDSNIKIRLDKLLSDIKLKKKLSDNSVQYIEVFFKHFENKEAREIQDFLMVEIMDAEKNKSEPWKLPVLKACYDSDEFCKGDWLDI
jgi:hypothetical protein